MNVKKRLKMIIENNDIVNFREPSILSNTLSYMTFPDYKSSKNHLFIFSYLGKLQRAEGFEMRCRIK